MVSRSDCLALDEATSEGSRRERFDLPDDIIYLDGNSLGAMPSHVSDRVARVVDVEWGVGLIRSWNTAAWIDLPTRIGDRIARLIGAPPDSVVVCDSMSINLFKVVSSALVTAPHPVVLSDTGNFPTDLYITRSVCDSVGAELKLVDPEHVRDGIDESVGVVSLTQVDYRTGRRHDLDEITRLTHQVGAVSIWDLAHSAGAFPVDLTTASVDYAIGCGYKYLNGGPGAPAFVFVAPHRQERFQNPITGWFGHEAPFDFDLAFRPAPGVQRATVGTTHVISMTALDAALDVFDDVDLAHVEKRAASLTQTFIDLVDELGGFEIVTPRDPKARGSQVSLRHDNAYPIVQAMIARGVIGDFRAPDIARYGFAPLYVRHLDVFDAAMQLHSVMTTGDWQEPRYSTRNAVT